MTQLVYLAGPIQGLSYGASTDWRGYVRAQLPGGIEAISPLRGKEFLSKETVIHNAYPDQLMSTEKAIYYRDMFDVGRCDVLLANFQQHSARSLGTVAEISWAAWLHKPIVVVMDAGRIHDHPFVTVPAGWITEDLDEAIAAVVSILSTH